MRAPHVDARSSTPTPGGCTRSPSTPGRASSSCTSRPSGRRRWPTRWRGPAASLANYGIGDLVTGAHADLPTSRPTTRCCSRTTTSATTAARCTPSCTRLVPSFGGGGSDLDWARRHPAPRGRLDLHHDRHDRPRAAARPRRGRAHPAQGRPRLPQPACSRRRPTTSRRSCCCRAAVDGDRGRVQPALRGRRGRRARASTRPTPSSCGTSSTSRTGRSASRCSAACRRAATGTAGSPRWRTRASTSAAGCCRGVAQDGEGPVTETLRRRRRRPRRPRLRDRARARAARAARWSGSSASSSATTAAPATTPAGSCGTATTPRRTSGLTQQAYDDWARLERDTGEQLVTVVGGVDLFPPDPAIPPGRLRRLAARGRHRPRAARRRGDPRPLAAAAPARRHARALPGRRGDRARRPRHRG